MLSGQSPLRFSITYFISTGVLCWPLSFTPDQREVFIYGLLFLLASSFAEARIFVYYNF